MGTVNPIMSEVIILHLRLTNTADRVPTRFNEKYKDHIPNARVRH